jgi:GNAT superfamily N-acetyltransferase
VDSVRVRLASGRDRESLLRMPPYLKSSRECPSRKEDVLVAVNGGVVYGAVSVSRKDILCVHGEWRDRFERRLNSLVSEVSGGWISKLYVFPEYRRRGVGTKLVGEALEHLREKGFAEAYAGIYVKNRFRNVSERIFKRNGFNGVGSCVCFLVDGHCRGVLLKKAIVSGE